MSTVDRSEARALILAHSEPTPDGCWHWAGSSSGGRGRVWIDGQPNKDSYELPSVVEWNAGTFFPTIARVEASADPTFAARFSYYGPTSIQARMCWADGHEAVTYIFAHFPGAGPAVTNPPV